MMKRRILVGGVLMAISMITLAAGYVARLSKTIVASPVDALRLTLRFRVYAASPVPPHTVVLTNFVTTGPGEVGTPRFDREPIAKISTQTTPLSAERVQQILDRRPTAVSD